MAMRAAPPMRAPRATAAVGMAPPWVEVAVVWTWPVALLISELRDSMALEMDAASEPVAVLRADDRSEISDWTAEVMLAMALVSTTDVIAEVAPLATELATELASDMTDEASLMIELASETTAEVTLPMTLVASEIMFPVVS